MNISVLGYTGFVGQHILAKFPSAVGVSLRDKDWRTKIIESDVIINLVGKAHDHNNLGTKEDYYYANFELTKEIFNFFVKSKARMLIHLSSIAAIEEYKADFPLNENHESHSNSWYGKSKFEAEKWLINQLLPNEKSLIILRPPMIHGPGDKGNLKLLYKFVEKGIPNPLFYFTNKRSFIYIENFLFYLNAILDDKKLSSGVYHLADNESLSTKEIIQIIEKELNRKNLSIPIPRFILFGFAKIGDIFAFPLNTKKVKKISSNLLVNNEKINNMLNIEKLPYTAEEGLKETIHSFRVN